LREALTGSSGSEGSGESVVKRAISAGKDAITDQVPSAIGGALTNSGGLIKGAVSGVASKIGLGSDDGDDGDDGKLKLTNIVEDIDVGVPKDVAYDQWTQFTDFPSFTKRVQDVNQVSDEEVRWTAKILWSTRTWTAQIIDQVPGERIVWRSSGEKGHVDGAVTFHELAPNLTRVVLVMEYHPSGLFEKTGNIWRAQGRRARLELKHFKRHVMTHALLHADELEGWHGEIHEGEVAKQHDEEGESGAGGTDAGNSGEQAGTSTKKSEPAKKGTSGKKSAPAKKGTSGKKSAPAKKSASAKKSSATNSGKAANKKAASSKNR
jgi:uncharacterized membrane protein